VKRQFTRRVIERGLRKIDAQPQGGTRHDLFVYIDEASNIRLPVQVPRHSGDIPRGTVQSIIRQLQLQGAELSDLVECPLSAEEYATRVRARLGK